MSNKNAKIDEASMSTIRIPASQDGGNSCALSVEEMLLQAEIESLRAETRRIAKEHGSIREKLRLIRKVGESRLPVEKKNELTQRILAGGAL